MILSFSPSPTSVFFFFFFSLLFSSDVKSASEWRG